MNDLIGVFVCQDYLRSIHQLYEDWLINQSSFKLPAPVLVRTSDTPALFYTAAGIHGFCVRDSERNLLEKLLKLNN